MNVCHQRHPDSTTTALAAAFAFSAAAVLCWLAAWLLPADATWLRAALGLASLALAAGLASWLYHHTVSTEQAVCEYLLHLAEDGRDSTAPPAPAPPPLGSRSHFDHALAELHAWLAKSCERLAAAEHARSVLELKQRRGAVHAERLERVLQALPEPLVAVDGYGDLWLANTSAEKLLRLPPAGRKEKRTLEDAACCERLMALVDEVRRRKVATTRSDDIELLQADGSKACYRATATGLAADAQTARQAEAVDAVVVTLRDITAQKLMQRSHAEFVSAASHEMKAPLSGIKAYVELLADNDAEDEEEREEFLTVINSQADRLQRLIENLLNLARIEAGVVQVSKQPQSLNDVLLEALRVVQPAAEAKQIILSEQLSPMYLGVLADRDMLLQAAINLLSNAVKYTRHQGSVVLRSRMLDGEAQFEVEDTGVGLSSEDCQRIFSKFYRVARNKDMAPGTGLGLPLAKYIIEDVHSGRLTVASTLDVGSTFTVTLPAAGKAAAGNFTRSGEPSRTEVG